MKSKNALCGLAIVLALHFGVLAGSAQTNKYLFTGSETNITLNPGAYIISAYGAPGGGPGPKSYGGLGAEMSAEFTFSKSTALTFLVGGAGDDYQGDRPISGGGGGGGSYVIEGSTPLVVAGGGGGVGGNNSGDNGSVSANGDDANSLNIPGIPVGAGDGGANGGGGAGGVVRYYQAGPPFTCPVPAAAAS